MNFSDFKDNPSGLIGKKVLRGRNEVATIERVTKTGFAINGSKSLFSLEDGWKKGSGAWDFESVTLLSDEEANKKEAENLGNYIRVRPR